MSFANNNLQRQSRFPPSSAGSASSSSSPRSRSANRSSTQPLTRSEHSPNYPPQNSQLSDNSSDSDDDHDLGFQVYKDQPSNARYVNLANVPTTPTDAPSNPSNRYSSYNSPSYQSYQPSSYSNLPVNHPSPRPSPAGAPLYSYYSSDHVPAAIYPSSSHQLQPPPITSPIRPSNLSYPKPASSDLVHMPALGSDWDKNESKKDKDWEGKDKLINKSKWSNRKNNLVHRTSRADHQFRDFLRGRRKLAGWFTRTMALGVVIFLFILAALLSYFLVPRVPTIAYNNEKTIAGDSSKAELIKFETLEPVYFSFNAKINLAMIAKKSYIKPKASDIKVTIIDLSSSPNNQAQVATGSLQNNLSVDTKDYTPFEVDLKFQYSAKTKEDSVWTSWHNACAHKWPGKGDRPTLEIGIIVDFKVVGLLGQFSERTILPNFECPIELSTSAA